MASTPHDPSVGVLNGIAKLCETNGINPVDERVDAGSAVIDPLDEADLEAKLRRCARRAWRR